MGRPEGQLSVKDKMASDMFVRDFVGRAKTDLNAAIKSGLVDPNATSAPAQTSPTQPSTQPAAPAQPTQPSATAPTTPGVQSPEEIRKARQATAAGVAQKQMAANPAVAKTAPLTLPPMTPNQVVQSPGQNQQAQQAPNPPPPGFTRTNPNQPPPAPKTKRYNNANATDVNVKQPTATPSKPKVPPALPSPTLRLKEENFNTIESKFAKLNAVFEAIVDPAQPQAMSIAQYMKRMFTKYLKGVKINDPQVQKQLDTLAQEVQSSKGSTQALTKLANLAYSVSYADNNGDGVPDTKQTSTPSALDAISAGFKKGMGKPVDQEASTVDNPPDKPPAGGSSGSGDNPPPPPPGVGAVPSQADKPVSGGTSSTPQLPPPAAGAVPNKEIDTAKEPQKAQTVYAQIKTLIPKMDKKGKQRIVAYLDKQLGVAPVAAPAGPNVMGNMVNQLAGNAPATTSSPTSVVNKASATNPNQAPKAVSRVAQARQKQAVKKAKIADAPYKPA